MSTISRRGVLTSLVVTTVAKAAHALGARASSRPKIAIVIDDMGPEAERPDLAIALPAEVTLSFMPFASKPIKQQDYVENLDGLTGEALRAGHELLLHMPMEPKGHADPGPGALRVGMSRDEIRRDLKAAIGIFGRRIVGMNNHEGSRFTADPKGMQAVVEVLKQHHLFLLDSRTDKDTVAYDVARANGVPAISRKVFLDDNPPKDMAAARRAVMAQLAATERAAEKDGYAVAIGHPHPATMKALEEWLPRARGYRLVRLSELVQQ